MSVKGVMAQTVLVVDDDPSIVDFLMFFLEDAGYNVLCAYDGRQALEAARQHLPQLIITDLMMPLMDGAALLAALHKDPELHQITTILMSAASRERLRQHEADADIVVAKPLDLEVLDGILRRLLADRSSPKNSGK